MQSIGTSASIPADSWSRGGIAAPVDLATGTLGVGRMRPLPAARGRAGEWSTTYTHHPESGAVIAGAVLPNWPRVAETALRAAAMLPCHVQAEWDVVVDEDAASIILGGTGSPALHELQVHGGLLGDERVRAFYEHHGAARRRHTCVAPRSR